MRGQPIAHLDRVTHPHASDTPRPCSALYRAERTTGWCLVWVTGVGAGVSEDNRGRTEKRGEEEMAVGVEEKWGRREQRGEVNQKKKGGAWKGLIACMAGAGDDTNR